MKTFYKIAISIMTTSALVTAGSLAYSWYTQTHQEDTPVTTVETTTSTTEETTSTEETTTSTTEETTSTEETTTSTTEETTTFTTEETSIDYRQYDTLNTIQWVDGDTLLLGGYPYEVFDIVGNYLIVGVYDEQKGQEVYTLIDLGNGVSPMYPIPDYNSIVNVAYEQSKSKMYEN